MRFETLVFERYGAFTDRVLELREGAHLHVVLGANEAGKTSALNAIGDLLFGFGKTTNFAFLHDQKTLRVGARLRFADGSGLFLRRRKGSKNTLLDADDKPLADDLLAGALGSVTREVFVSEFGLTAEALRKGGEELVKAGGRLAETLAASSARLSMLARTRARLEAEADALFGPRRAAGKEFYAALDQHQDAERHLREAIVTADALATAEAAVAEAQVKRQSLGAEHDRIGRDLARRERALRTASKLRQLDSLRAELAGLADLPDVDVETLASWRDAHDEATRIEKELADQQLEEAEGAAAIAELMVDEPLLEIGGKIDTLNKELGAVGQAEIDLPGRQRDAFSAQTSLDNAASLLGLEGHEALLARQPSDLALSLVRELTDARRNLERRLAEAHSALMAARHELQELEQASAKRGSCADPAPFLQRLEAFADIPADADRLRRETFARSLALSQLSEEAARLDPATPALDRLARLALPDAARIEEARQTLLALDEEEKRVGAEKKAMRDSLATIEEEIRSLSLAGAFSTRDELGAAREKRDRAYALLDAALDGGLAERRKIFMGLGVANRQVDATTDGLLDGAERAARFEAARERRVKEQRAYERLADLHDQILARRGVAWTEWRELWAGVGLKPEAPQLMAAWLKNVNDILQRRARLAEQGLEHDALAQKLGAQRAALMRLVEDMGVDANVALPIEALYKYARAALDRLQAGWTETHAKIALKDKVAEVFARAKESHAQIVRENEGLHDAWPGALIAIGLAGELTPGQAEAALAVWKSVPLHKQKLSIERDRIEKMQVRISAFEKQVAELVALAAPDLRERPSREALDILSGRLAEARRAHERRETLRKDAQKRALAGAKLQQRRAGGHERLAAARTTLGLDESAPLPPPSTACGDAPASSMTSPTSPATWPRAPTVMTRTHCAASRPISISICCPAKSSNSRSPVSKSSTTSRPRRPICTKQAAREKPSRRAATRPARRRTRPRRTPR